MSVSQMPHPTTSRLLKNIFRTNLNSNYLPRSPSPQQIPFSKIPAIRISSQRWAFSSSLRIRKPWWQGSPCLPRRAAVWERKLSLRNHNPAAGPQFARLMVASAPKWALWVVKRSLIQSYEPKPLWLGAQQLPTNRNSHSSRPEPPSL